MISRRILAVILLWVSLPFFIKGAERPNILWLTSEDHGPHMGCYGDALARTPHVDALAAKGMRFKTAWSCAPVCAPARTTMITGMYPTSMGAEHMRSEVPMPDGTRMFPQLLREAGYYCTNHSKEDYNLVKPGKVWDESSGKAHWRNRKPDQPFFAVFNSTVSHESQIRKRPHRQRLDPAHVRIPAYHPDTPEVRQDWAQYYDQVSEADAAAGKHLDELEKAGLAGNTIVFYFADHGSGMPRSKRWPCNSGLQVPMVVYFPEKWRYLAPIEYKPGGVSDRLVSFVDLAPTLLSFAQVRPPNWMQGFAFAGKYQQLFQNFVYGFRGRMDERIDLVRSVTDGRYVYLRNYMPHLSQGQHVGYQFETPTTRVWRRLFEQGKLNEAQSIFWREPKAAEELYDLAEDPDEVRNLAGSGFHQGILIRMRQAQKTMAQRIRDTGFLAEAEMHRRSNRKSPRDALNSEQSYDFHAIFSAADLATMGNATSPELLALLQSPESGVRYWGAMGFLAKGKKLDEGMGSALKAVLNDDSPSVRIAAAEALGRLGSREDLPLVLKTLKECADPTKAGIYGATAAMNAINHLGEKADSLLPFIQTMPTHDPKAPQRANEYVQRLRQTILEKGK